MSPRESIRDAHIKKTTSNALAKKRTTGAPLGHHEKACFIKVRFMYGITAPFSTTFSFKLLGHRLRIISFMNSLGRVNFSAWGINLSFSTTFSVEAGIHWQGRAAAYLKQNKTVFAVSA